MTQNVLLHIILMALGVVVLLGAAFVGKTDKGGKRLNAHKVVAATGAAIVFGLALLTMILGILQSAVAAKNMRPSIADNIVSIRPVPHPREYVPVHSVKARFVDRLKSLHSLPPPES